MKTKEELNALKEEVETVSRKLHGLSEQELEMVTGGQKVMNEEGDLPIDSNDPHCVDCRDKLRYLYSDNPNRYDIYQCLTCGQRYLHLWDGDKWMRY